MAEQGTVRAEVAHPALADPALRRFVAEVRARYGERLERLVLFGSRARGDHRPDSDYDVALFLHGFTTIYDELGPVCEVTTDILVDTDADISPKVFPAGAWRTWTPFMDEVQRDGVDL